MSTAINAELLDLCLGMADLIDRCGVKVNADFDRALRAAIEKTEDAAEQMQPKELPIIAGLLRRHELEQGKNYEVVDAEGNEVQGTFEELRSAAAIQCLHLNDQNEISFDYAGDSTVFWDDQQPVLNGGLWQFVEAGGEIRDESEIYYREVQS